MFRYWSTLILFLAIKTGAQSLPSCPPGVFCAREYPFKLADTCGIFLANKTDKVEPVGSGNYTWTNATNTTNVTAWTLQDTLIDQSLDIYSNYDLGFLDGTYSCASSAVKTEFPTNRSNQTCGTPIDVDALMPILQERWHYIHYGKSQDNPAESCLSILQHNSALQSGMYWIQSGNGTAVQVYCEMQGTNCDNHGGWMRVIKIDLNDANYYTCLNNNFEIYIASGKPKICRRVQYQGGCVSAYLNVQGQDYSMVCGKARGYQMGTTDSFERTNAQSLTPDHNYVDGISLTHGTNPRHHIFTYASGCSESGSCWAISECPCQTGATSQFPKFLGYNDFYCESGSYWHPWGGGFYTDPLWDGKDCAWKEAPCCSSNRLPWFYQALPSKTNDNIEFRVCTASPKSGEDVGFDQLEIYIK